MRLFTLRPRRAPVVFGAVVVAALRAAEQGGGRSSLAVSASSSDGWLQVVVRLSGGGSMSHADFIDVADRIGALGGRLALDPIEDGFRVTAEVPCG